MTGQEERGGALRARSTRRAPARKLSRLLARLAERRAKRNPKVERIILAVAAVVFLAATVIAAMNLPDIEGGVRWLPLVLLAVIAVPLTVVWNGIEYAFTGKLVHQRVPVREALRVSVLSSAANLLPVPGAIIVRSRALTQLGTGYGKAIGSTAVVGLARIALSFLAAGAALIGAGGDLRLGAGLAVVGCLGIGAVGVVVRTNLAMDRPLQILVVLLGIEGGFVAILGARMWLVLVALGYGGLSEALGLALAAVVATASGFFPGGFGARELLSGAVSPLIGLPATIGIVTAAIDRVIGLTVLAVIAIALLALRYDASDLEGSYATDPDDPADSTARTLQ